MNKITGLNNLQPKTVRVETLTMGTLVRWKGSDSPESVYIVDLDGEVIDLSGDGYLSSDVEVTVIPEGTVLTITVGKES